MRVGLFATCLVDMMRPRIGFAALRLLGGDMQSMLRCIRCGAIACGRHRTDRDVRRPWAVPRADRAGWSGLKTAA